MVLVAQFIGITIIFIGGIIMVQPETLQKVLAFWNVGYRLYLAAVLRFIFGVIFIGASSEGRSPIILLTLGIVFILSAVIFVVIRLDQWKRLISQFLEKPVLFFRLWSLVALLIGSLIVYAV